MDEEKRKFLLCKLVEQEYHATVQGCSIIGEGGAGKVYKINFDKAPFSLCVKMYKTASLNEQQAYEMRYLNQFSDIKFPEVYFIHHETPEIPLNVLGMEIVNGTSACNNKFYWYSQKKRRNCANLVVDSLIKIHSQTNTKFGDLKNPFYSSWNQYYYELSTKILKQSRDSVRKNELNAAYLDVMELAYSHFEDIFCEDVKHATLIHGDFFIANILVEPKSLEPLAFIDPYESMWADVDYELFALDNVNGNCFHLFETYKSKVELSKMCEIKCAFYALFKEIMWFHVYGEKSDPFIKGLCGKLKRQLHAYHMI